MSVAFWIGVALIAACSVVLWMIVPGSSGDYMMPAWAIRAISAATLLRRIGCICLAIAAVLWLVKRFPPS